MSPHTVNKVAVF